MSKGKTTNLMAASPTEKSSFQQPTWRVIYEPEKIHKLNYEFSHRSNKKSEAGILTRLQKIPDVSRTNKKYLQLSDN